MIRRTGLTVLVASLASLFAVCNAAGPRHRTQDLRETKKSGPRGVKRSLADYDSFEEEMIRYEHQFHSSGEDYSSHDVDPWSSPSYEDSFEQALISYEEQIHVSEGEYSSHDADPWRSPSNTEHSKDHSSRDVDPWSSPGEYDRDPWSYEGQLHVSEEDYSSHDVDPWGSSPTEHSKDHSSHDVDPWSSPEEDYVTYDRDPWSAYFGGAHKKPKGAKQGKKGDKKEKAKPEAHAGLPKKTKGIKGEKGVPAKHAKEAVKVNKAPKTFHHRPNPVYGHPIWDDSDLDKPGHDKPEHHDKPVHHIVHHKPKPSVEESSYPIERPHDDGDQTDAERRVVVRFVLQFTVGYPRDPSLDDLDVITAQTDVYLSDYLTKFFEKYAPGVTIDYFSLLPTEGIDPVVHDDTISLDYKGFAFFESHSLPTVGDMSQIIEDAFLGDNLTEFLRRVNTLPDVNVFASTTLVIMLTTVQDDGPSMLYKTLENTNVVLTTSADVPVKHSSTASSFALIAAVAAAALVALAVAFAVYRQQHHGRQGEDEDDLIGDETMMVEREIGDGNFEVSSSSSSTRAENFLRLVAHDGDEDSGNSAFRIEMGGR